MFYLWIMILSVSGFSADNPFDQMIRQKLAFRMQNQVASFMKGHDARVKSFERLEDLRVEFQCLKEDCEERNLPLPFLKTIQPIEPVEEYSYEGEMRLAMLLQMERLCHEQQERIKKYDSIVRDLQCNINRLEKVLGYKPSSWYTSNA